LLGFYRELPEVSTNEVVREHSSITVVPWPGRVTPVLAPLPFYIGMWVPLRLSLGVRKALEKEARSMWDGPQ
jgi:hypothetical protein